MLRCPWHIEPQTWLTLNTSCELERPEKLNESVNYFLKLQNGRVIENFARRIQVCLQRRGAHLEHIL